ncbi:hypothetical protein [Aliidiomarina soli]|uniref:Uncharacterized protein n=1 Tax=Aliidiomarina soli TaxID=1928574 RepID=A0A432WGY0_9GAMM|nr:hypothetical protein [Aliidiomarina soli]RUO33086.1 hypothetical protein CWE14_07605 [Aliidiomarina soli]
MSMHEFEDLVETSIRCLDQAGQHDSMELRTLFYNLYQFQEAWDTGFTHLRVLDILLKHKFVYQFEPTQHPDYSAHQAFFDNVRDFTFVGLHPEQRWNGDTNPTAGYIDPPYLYCDAGSPLWQQFVTSGVLTGDDAIPPAKLDMADLAKEVVVAGRAQNNRELISLWYTALGVDLWSFRAEDALDAAKSNRSIIAIREIAMETKALDIDPGYGLLQQPPPDAVKGYPFLSWWFQRRPRKGWVGSSFLKRIFR